MHLALWIVTGFLAVGCVAGGAIKLIVPKEKFDAKGGSWTEDFSVGSVKAIGALELLAGVGLVLPAALGIVPVLVPLAAVGFVLLMIGAIVTHVRRKEPKVILLNLTYLALAGFVAWGRLGPESFTG